MTENFPDITHKTRWVKRCTRHIRFRAQFLNSDLRVPASKELQAELLNSTAVNSNRLRLVQNAASTRILEAILAAMLISATVAAFLMDSRRVLPKNLCRIAAMANLLVDSNMLNNTIISERLEWLSGKLQSRDMFSDTCSKWAGLGVKMGIVWLMERERALAGKSERANFTIYIAEQGGHCKFARTRWIVRRKRRA